MSVRERQISIETVEQKPEQLRFFYLAPEDKVPTFIRDKGTIDVCHTTIGDRDVYVLEDVDTDLTDGLQVEQLFVKQSPESTHAINIAIRETQQDDTTSYFVDLTDYMLAQDDDEEMPSWRPVRPNEDELVIQDKALPFIPEAGYLCGVFNTDHADFLVSQGIDTTQGMPFAVVCDAAGNPARLRYADNEGIWQTMTIDTNRLNIVQFIAPATKAIVTPNDELVVNLANRVTSNFQTQEEQAISPEVSDTVEIKEVQLEGRTRIAVQYRNGLPETWIQMKEAATLQQLTLRPEHYRWLALRTAQPIPETPREPITLTGVSDENAGYLVIGDATSQTTTHLTSNLGIEEVVSEDSFEQTLNAQKRDAKAKMNDLVLGKIMSGHGFQIDNTNNVWIVAVDTPIAEQSVIDGVKGHKYEKFRESVALAPVDSTLIVRINDDLTLTYISGNFRQVRPTPVSEMPFGTGKTITQVIKTTGKDNPKVRQAFMTFVSEGTNPFEVSPENSLETSIAEKKGNLDQAFDTLPSRLANYIHNTALPRLLEQKIKIITDVLSQKVGESEATIPDILASCRIAFSETEIAQFMSMQLNDIIKYSIEKDFYNPNMILSIAREIAHAAGEATMTNDETITYVQAAHRRATILSISAAQEAGTSNPNAWREELKTRLPQGLSETQIRKLHKIIDKKELRGIGDVNFVEFPNLLSYYETVNETQRRGFEAFDSQEWTDEQIEARQQTDRIPVETYYKMIRINQKDVQRFTHAPEIVHLGPERIRDDIPTNEGPFHVFTEYEVHYPTSVVEALARMYREYNEAFRALVDKNREWETDYMYALTSDGMPINFGVQMDINGLTSAFLEEAQNLSVDEVYTRLKDVFEIENSLAMYGLLMRITSKNGEETPFAIGWRETLDQIRTRTGKKIALIAVTDDKYQHMKEAEFGKTKDEELTDDKVREISGFDRFFSPDEYKRYVEEHGEDSEYVLYCRTSDPLATLEDPTNIVEHTLLSDPTIRRIMKKYSLTFNIDNPEWERGDDRRINDTKRYLIPMGRGYQITSADQLRSPEFKEFLLSRGADPVEVASGQVVVRGKPDTAYGCYGQERGAIGDDQYIATQQELIDNWGMYIAQPEMTIPTVQDDETGERYTVAHRVFLVTVDGIKYKLLQGYASHMPVKSIEAERGRNHGSKFTKLARILEKPKEQHAVVQ